MNPEKPGFSAVKTAYNSTLKYLKTNPALFIPFLVFFCFEFISLVIIYLAPRMPLRLVFGPIIKTLWSEIYLHYPNNFLLLPKLAYLARMGLAIVIGSLLSAIAVTMIVDVYHKKQLNFKNSLLSALKNYPSFLIIVFLSVFLFYFSVKVISALIISYFLNGHTRLLFLPVSTWAGPILFFLNFFLAIVIQAAFVYAIPVIIIEKEKLVKAIWRSFLFFKQALIPSIILVGVPMIIFIPLSILNYNTALLIQKFFPEVILFIAFLSAVLSSLVIEPIITVSTTILYLTAKKK